MESVTLLASVPAILALVNLAKKLGLSGQGSLVLSVVLGIALNVLNTLYGEQALYQSAVQGLILGLSAAGLYDFAKRSANADSYFVSSSVLSDFASEHDFVDETPTQKRSVSAKSSKVSKNK